MIRIIDKQNLGLEMPIGDTAVLPITVTNKNTGEPMVNPGDKVKFVLKKNKGDEYKDILTKEITITENDNHVANISFIPEDTKNLEPDMYVHTIRLYRADGNIDTLNGLNPHSMFVLKKGVV